MESNFKRKILFMDYPGEEGQSNYVNFTRNIINQYKEFFRSDAGGCWNEDEFIDINENQPHSLNVQRCSEELRKLQDCDFSIVVFVGHGCNYRSTDMIQLNSNNILFSVEQLYANASKRLVIIDSCRSYLNNFSVPSLYFNTSESKNLSRERNKETYNQIIKDIPNHIELIQSTQKGCTAGTLSSAKNSVFSKAFLEQLNKFASHGLCRSRRLMDINEPFRDSYKDIKALVDAELAQYNQQSDYNCYIGNQEYTPSDKKGYFPLLCIDDSNNLLLS